MQVPTAEQAGREGLVGTQLPEEDDSLTPFAVAALHHDVPCSAFQLELHLQES